MDDNLVVVITIFLVSLLIIACLAMSYGYEYLECINKTSEIGFPYRFKIIGGCQIEVNPGQWIPLESYYFKQE